MLQIRKNYHSLEALSSKWGVAEADIRYLAVNGLLLVSVRLFGVFPESYLEDDQPPSPLGDRSVDGPVNLHRRDVDTLFRDGSVQVRQLGTEEHCALLLDDDQVITVRQADLVVREEERVRFEAEELPRIRHAGKLPSFSNLDIGGKHYTFEPMPVLALEELYRRGLEDDSDHYGPEVCKAIGSSSLRLGDIFRRSRDWRDLIEHCGKGRWRFIPARVRELYGQGSPTG